MAETCALLHTVLPELFAELTTGAKTGAAFMLNGGDPGLLASLDQLSAPAASAIPPAGGASIAAHVDHLRYGLSLMNRWHAGEANPWATADWSESWRRTTVSREEWASRRAELRSGIERWQAALKEPRPLNALEMSGVIASVAHLAYHLGAIRQIDRSIRGPAAA